MHQLAALFRGAKRVPADLDQPFAMTFDMTAEMIDQHLRAETDAEQRLALLERHRQPVRLAPHELLVMVVRAHWPAKNHHASVMGERFGKLVAKRRPAYVEIVTRFDQHMPDTAGTGRLLMQDDQDPGTFSSCRERMDPVHSSPVLLSLPGALAAAARFAATRSTRSTSRSSATRQTVLSSSS